MAVDHHINPASGVWDDNYWANTGRYLAGEGGSGSSGSSGSFSASIPAFQFDYDEAEIEALEKLRPYYEQKLREAEGDVERAKGFIDDDYRRGTRIRVENRTIEQAADVRTREQELNEAMTGLNRRGILTGQIPSAASKAGESRAPFSGVAQKFTLNPLSERQKARKQAIELAFRRGEEVAGIERKRDKEDLDIALPRFTRDLEEEKRTRVQTEFIPLAEQRARTKFEASRGDNVIFSQ